MLSEIDVRRNGDNCYVQIRGQLLDASCLAGGIMTVPRPRARRGHGRDAGPSSAVIRVPVAFAAAIRRLDWTGEAACRDVDPELFFPEGTAGPASRQAELAKQVCQTCPVRKPCLAVGLEQSPGSGIWGGTTPEERLAMRRAIVRRRP
jgi:WhiB family transcriptional regulator, redox-sensing transcriptional regulator